MHAAPLCSLVTHIMQAACVLHAEARALREKLEKKLTGTEQVFDKPRKLKT